MITEAELGVLGTSARTQAISGYIHNPQYKASKQKRKQYC
jgi:hypothetical protein